MQKEKKNHDTPFINQEHFSMASTESFFISPLKTYLDFNAGADSGHSWLALPNVGSTITFTICIEKIFKKILH